MTAAEPGVLISWRGDIGVECRCGAEYQARTGQLIEEPICSWIPPTSKHE